MNDFDFPLIIRTIAVFAIPVLFAIALHEVAHGYTAKFFGDPTAADEGRLSLNPYRHIDPFGTIVLPILLYLAVHTAFGYAKPVPVDFNRLRKPKQQMVWVAAAGPAANFCMAVLWTVFGLVLKGSGVTETYFLEMARAGVLVNAAMMVFNLIPVPPLDGGRIVTGLLPDGLARIYGQLDRYSMYVFAALVMLVHFGVLDGFLRGAILLVIRLITVIVSPLAALLR